MIRARHGGAIALGAAALLALGSATSAVAVVAPPGSGNNEFQSEPGTETVNRAIPASMSAARVPASGAPQPATLPVIGGDASATITGLTMKDQRLADDTHQFSLEPPDQGLCVGLPVSSGQQVLEAVNDVFRFHNLKTRASSDAISLTKFFTGESQIIRNVPGGNPPVLHYGAFLSDPKCYVDPASGRFFLSILEIDTDPATGAFGSRSATYLAVSKTKAPTVNASDWYFYMIDTTDDGTPDQSGRGIGVSRTNPPNLVSQPGCPCFGDQPLIGADKYGFYVTTNEFSISGPEFNGAQIYALDKAALESGTFRMQAFHGTPIPLAEGPAYSLQPATSPTAGDWDTASNGTAYLLSALDFNATLDNRIAEWRLTNTRSLRSGTPHVVLQAPAVIGSEVYGQPPAAVQRAGYTPLGDVLKAKENLLNTNDDRMNQAVLQGGHLWGAVNTVIKNNTGPVTTGIAWFAVDTARNKIANQGYVAVSQQSVFFPSISIGTKGSGVMTFSLAGPDYYPSSAYVRLGLAGVSGSVRLMGLGVLPADGFAGYKAYGGNGVERWGDYSAAVPDYSGTGDVWVAAEDIPGTYGFNDTFVDANGSTQPFLANWGTTIAKVSPIAR